MVEDGARRRGGKQKRFAVRGAANPRRDRPRDEPWIDIAEALTRLSALKPNFPHRAALGSERVFSIY